MPQSMKAVVLYESRSGNTMRAAELVAGALQAAGADVVLRPVLDAPLDETANADILFIGTWVDGAIIAGHRPGGQRNLRLLPDLWDIPVAAFMTYAIYPGRVTSAFARFLEHKGARVVLARAFHRKRLPAGIAEFVADAIVAADVTLPQL